MSHADWPFVYREIHFCGGIRGIIKPQEDILFFSPTINNEVICEKFVSYPSFTDLAQNNNLVIIGIDYYNDNDQLSGLYPPKLVPFIYVNGVEYLNIIQKMSEIRYGAYVESKFEFMYSLCKIEEWTKASARALKNISNSYYMTLSAINTKNDNEYKSFIDNNCDFIFDAIHNSLYYMATLRDHAAEFIVKYLSESENKKFNKIRIMSRLIEHIHEYNDFTMRGDIKNKILDSNNINKKSIILPGWLQFLYSYRNSVTHDRPIHMMNLRTYPCRLLSDICGYTVYRLKFPIPNLPLVQESSYNNEYLKEILKSPLSLADAEQALDGLELCFRIYMELLNFLNYIMEYSPIAPQSIILRPNKSLQI